MAVRALSLHSASARVATSDFFDLKILRFQYYRLCFFCQKYYLKDFLLLCSVLLWKVLLLIIKKCIETLREGVFFVVQKPFGKQICSSLG